jgi:hypothetical protein
MWQLIIRFTAATAVLGGMVFTGAGEAAADSGYPATGDPSSSAQPGCGESDINVEQGCFLGWGRFFK